MQIGDFLVPPTIDPKLAKALAIISEYLHPSFEANPTLKPGISRESCVLCSLTVREFLVKIGFKADVRKCSVTIDAHLDGNFIKNLGIGHPSLQRGNSDKTRWSGHLVVDLQEHDLIIDTTLYQARRPEWPELPGMAVIPTNDALDMKVNGLKPFAAMLLDDESRVIRVFYLDDPLISDYRKGNDAIKKDRRVTVVKKMLAVWNERPWAGP